MLAILDPELRRGAPSRRQTVGLVSGLAVLSLVVGAAVPVARAADGPVRPNGGATVATSAATDTPSFLDEEMSQAVRTVERKETRQQISRRVDSVRVRSDLGTAIGAASWRWPTPDPIPTAASSSSCIAIINSRPTT